ncbi:MAG: DoxX family membrane protein [Candidatus Caldarchaeum sp.]|nr:DoxX family membrane protein [Candidatus Caldarchaeum sp.]MDW8360580.1 DoxX family membrane protein [Candidatus Caldarchaeum sp.]
MSKILTVWILLLRLSVGGFWLFFASQRWLDRSWVRELFTTAAEGNYIPLYGDLLRSLTPSWDILVLVITLIETAVGLMIILGVYPRAAALLGAAVALNLWLTFVFCDCWWNRADAPQVFWFYFSALLLNLAVLREKSPLRIIPFKRKRPASHVGP